jgi:hypothetical protein
MLSEQYDTSGCTSLKCLADISKRLQYYNTNLVKNWWYTQVLREC